MSGIEEFLADAMTLPGARSVAVVDWRSGLALGVAGDVPGGGGDVVAVETAELGRLVVEQTAFRPGEGAGAGPQDTGSFVEDVIVATRTEFHVLRFAGTGYGSGALLHLRLGRMDGNLALARLRLRILAAELQAGL